ncbi:hypothetical protein KC318_g4682 [Hortaea werneckii]|uniref:AB hydrolase-1 domain-containing protein n=1 Tax=Hortaea werneckii TaxID=91943 RepID=A0A3M7A699_HORWE|nr:hypothetical protein KC334_g2103 [Hortaea werneckii]KAI7020386.1 hypothetical protein KC355_g2750 [Hortaea werneckii]KAI7669415.1 hypothetical protein KC318_g4682 [Hortaea werneckii]RMY22981.1 hypothetical protein D0867_02352 [Hortaea werneckii]RMY38736.1 hypothetical protein D0866_02394 [Hortaea werneckii]
MDLPLTFRFQGWNIRYHLLSSSDSDRTSTKQPQSVVFVHGTPWSSVVFQPLIETLRAKEPYQILVYDLPGYGQSQEYHEPVDKSRATQAPSPPTATAFPGDTSVKFQSEALAALLSSVPLHPSKGIHSAGNSPSPPAIVAHDIAGAIVLRAHLLHGCDFASMLLMDTNAVLPWGDGFYKLVRSEPQTFVRLPLKIFEAVVRAVVQSACFNPNVLKTGWEDQLTSPWIDAGVGSSRGGEGREMGGEGERQKSFVRQIAQADDGDVAEMLDGNMYEKVRCRVKVLWGESDTWIPKEKIERLIEMLGDKVKEVAFIPEAGHLVMLDQPGRVAVEVYDWLNQPSE